MRSVYLVLFAVWTGVMGAACAAERPVTGAPVAGYEALDEAVQAFMDLVGCKAGTVAVSRDGALLYSRGFGWRDRRGTEPTAPDAVMRTASVSKPITAAAFCRLFQAGEMSPETPVFPLPGIAPPAWAKPDPRLGQVTVAHLLEHKGGWDRGKSFDPMFMTGRVEKSLRLERPARPEDVVRFMLGQPLQFDPGAESVYSNFGFCVLGRVLEKKLGMPYMACIRTLVLDPASITDIELGRDSALKRGKREVEYPVRDGLFSIEVMDAHGGLTASAPALCRFMDTYWITGFLRNPEEAQEWVFFGSLPGTLSMARQRKDGLNVAALFNGRREGGNEDLDLLKRTVDAALDGLVHGSPGDGAS